MRGRSTPRWLLAGAAIVLSLTFAASASADSYMVLYKGNAVPSSAKADVRKAGGTFVYGYDKIGVAIARSESSGFATALGKDNRVEGVSSTAQFASKLQEPEAEAAAGPQPGELPNEPATDGDSLSVWQWDMRQIHAPQAHAITGGSRSVVVGDIDTGLDFNHPDLRANVSNDDSANCLTGAPVQGAAAAMDDEGHGTHTAGTIAAADNGAGIVGVAPNVRIAGIKAGRSDGLFFPEAVVCSFMWAGDRKLDVTNNSYFADPWEYNCRNDPSQHAIWKAEQRAIKYAQSQGVTVVASAGNDSDDVSHPTGDVTSPDFPPGSAEEREVRNNCVVVPLEVSGVVGVSATGSTFQDTSEGEYRDNLKSFYSSFGVSAVDVAAPGGDSVYFTPESFNGRVLSTYPASRPCTRRRQEPGDATYPTATYCYLQGTSMAGPHVAGVAALIISRYGQADGSGARMSPGRVAAMLGNTADQQACPGTLPAGYLSFTGTNSGAVQECQGGAGHNSWYGPGQVDALNAVGG
ncbi:MAG TPA: S8 family serine peptidase [Solirubrobacteraceae bacterium]|nr:S8 family serine peptidase [Solirubrobacteraceae bacterium]